MLDPVSPTHNATVPPDLGRDQVPIILCMVCRPGDKWKESTRWTLENTLSEPENTNGAAGNLGSHTQARSKQEKQERE